MPIESIEVEKYQPYTVLTMPIESIEVERYQPYTVLRLDRSSGVTDFLGATVFLFGPMKHSSDHHGIITSHRTSSLRLNHRPPPSAFQ